MSAWKLRFSMIVTLAAIISLSTLFLAVALSLAGYFDFVTLGVVIVIFNIMQWLISPYLIGAIYRVREISEDENPKLHKMLENLVNDAKVYVVLAAL